MQVNSNCVVNPINIISVEIDIADKKDIYCLKFKTTDGKEYYSNWTKNYEILENELIDISKQLDNFTKI